MNRQKGFTLIELVVAIALVALITLGAASGIMQVFKVSAQNSEINETVRQAQNVGHWLSRDALMAESIRPSSGTVFLTMGWLQWETGETIHATYERFPSSGSLEKLVRTYSVHGNDGTLIESHQTLVADNIDSMEADWQTDGTWRVFVTARAGERTATREYQIYPRINY